MVDLPEPEGPEITMGRWIWVAGCRHCGISRCLRPNAWFRSYLMAPWYVTVRAQVDNVESARAGRQQSEENDASGQCSTYKSNCRKDEKGMSSGEGPKWARATVAVQHIHWPGPSLFSPRSVPG